MPPENTPNITYCFIDEGGNFDFSHKGSKYYTLTGLTMTRPFALFDALRKVKYDLLENSHNVQAFHACNDKQHVRDKVFTAIQSYLDTIRLDCIIIEKRKTYPALQYQINFYSKMMGCLAGYICRPFLEQNKKHKLIITLDSHPQINKKQKPGSVPVSTSHKDAMTKAIKQNIAHQLRMEHLPYSLIHHEAKTNFGLQIVDYCNWAIQRKWERGDTRSYDLIKPAIKSEFDIFRKGTVFFY